MTAHEQAELLRCIELLEDAQAILLPYVGYGSIVDTIDLILIDLCRDAGIEPQERQQKGA